MKNKKIIFISTTCTIVFVACLYLFTMNFVIHRNPFNGLKFVPSNMVKIPISSSENWGISKSTATNKLKKAGFDVQYIYDGPVNDNNLVDKATVDPIVDNKNVIQHYQRKKYSFNNPEDKIKYGYDVREGGDDYAPKGSTIVVRVKTNDLDKVISTLGTNN
ncbi:hypothetical protein [Lactococcus cremoris]|uniref:hypothetical protein n=1 Tax=Lactococcus lactis subsp. cremoris TaxID=1359 RepID=UPI0021824490|nr:hypothetical protein [Lactococcus cremoris]MCT0501497.1 hypothetical protein [Lactococcus cremoris]